MTSILTFLVALLAGAAIPDQCTGPVGVVIASWPIASIIRSQTATPARSPSAASSSALLALSALA